MPAAKDLVTWFGGFPNSDRIVMLKGSDYMGDYTLIGRFVRYKGKEHTGRWMDVNKKQRLKEHVSHWTEIVPVDEVEDA